MDERIRTLISDGAKDGAPEIYKQYEAYQQALKDAETNYNNQVAQINQDYSEAIKLYELIQSVTSSILNKLGHKE